MVEANEQETNEAPDSPQTNLERRVQEADGLAHPDEQPFPVPRHEYVLSRLNELKTAINDSFLEMAGLFCEANTENHWRQAGFDSFSDFVEGTVGMKYRTARYLMTVHETFIQQLNVPRALLLEVGWTKLKEIARVADADNVDEWLETARQSRTSQLIQIVRQRNTEETVQEYTTLSIGCFEAEKETIQGAIRHAMLGTENDRPAHNLAMICADYMAGADPAIPATAEEVPEARPLAEVMDEPDEDADRENAEAHNAGHDDAE